MIICNFQKELSGFEFCCTVPSLLNPVCPKCILEPSIKVMSVFYSGVYGDGDTKIAPCKFIKAEWKGIKAMLKSSKLVTQPTCEYLGILLY